MKHIGILFPMQQYVIFNKFLQWYFRGSEVAAVFNAIITRYPANIKLHQTAFARYLTTHPADDEHFGIYFGIGYGLGYVYLGQSETIPIELVQKTQVLFDKYAISRDRIKVLTIQL